MVETEVRGKVLGERGICNLHLHLFSKSETGVLGAGVAAISPRREGLLLKYYSEGEAALQDNHPLFTSFQ